MAGRIGFYGFSGGTVINRFFSGGHSHYFEPMDADRDHFMRKYWLPVLAQGADPDMIEERVQLNPLTGLAQAGLRMANPIKLAAYVLIAWTGFHFLYLEPRHEIQRQQAAREMLAAASMLEGNDQIPQALSIYARLLSDDEFLDQINRDEAVLAARFATQRLRPFDEAIEQIPLGLFFRWGGENYLRGVFPIRLSYGVVSFFSPPTAPEIISVDFDGTARITDPKTGQVLSTYHDELSDDGPVLDGVEFYLLSNAPKLLLVRFSLDRPNSDNVGRVALAVNLETMEIEERFFSYGVSSTADCTEFVSIPDQDEDDMTDAELAAQDAEKERLSLLAKKCVTEHIGTTPQFLDFPAALVENELWSAERHENEDAEPTSYPEDICGLSVHTDRFQFKIRNDADNLDYKSIGEAEEAPFSSEEIAYYLGAGDSDRDSCFVGFDAVSGRKFLLSFGMAGQWWVGYVVCEITPDNRVLACVGPRHAWNGVGKWSLSPEGRYLTMTGYGSDEGATWSIVDLDTLSIIEPEISPKTFSMSVVADEQNNSVVAATLQPGRAGAIELWLYRNPQQPELVERRTIDAPTVTFTEEERNTDPTESSDLFWFRDMIILVTPFQQVFAFQRVNFQPSLLAWFAEFPIARASMERATSLRADWIVTSAGFPESQRVKYFVDKDQDFLVMYSETHVRFLNLINGRFLTPAFEIRELGYCNGTIQKIGRSASARNINVEMSDCIAERAEPLRLPELHGQSGNTTVFFGEGNSLNPKLPGEISVN